MQTRLPTPQAYAEMRAPVVALKTWMSVASKARPMGSSGARASRRGASRASWGRCGVGGGGGRVEGVDERGGEGEADGVVGGKGVEARVVAVAADAEAPI